MERGRAARGQGSFGARLFSCPQEPNTRVGVEEFALPAHRGGSRQGADRKRGRWLARCKSRALTTEAGRWPPSARRHRITRRESRDAAGHRARRRGCLTVAGNATPPRDKNRTQASRPVALPPVTLGGCAMLQNLSEEFRECLRLAEECKQLSKTALTPSAIKSYLDMERRWLALVRSYEFAEGLSRFVEPSSRK
jgi:hypothetical protein